MGGNSSCIHSTLRLHLKADMTDAIPNFNSEDAAMQWMADQVDDPCTDNIRFAYRDDMAQSAWYRMKQNDGCCGSFDAEISINGRPAMIGCNYGH